MSETLTTPEHNTNLYTDRDMVSLIVTSFRLSRGNGNMQRGLLSFVADNYSERFGDQSIFDEALPAVREAGFETYRRTHAAASAEQARLRTVADVEVDRYMYGLRQFVAEGSMAPRYMGLSELAINIISGDRKLLNKFQLSDPAPKVVDTFSSNLVTHGLLHEPTGREEFDAAFEAATRIILHEPDRLDYDQPAEGANQIRQVITGHLDVHPKDERSVREAIAGAPLETYPSDSPTPRLTI